MAEKKYQVFVSSTYTDLKEEREQIIKEILKMDCIPAGMEYFPGVDESQMDYIHRVIDESDYFVLILGAKYGSVDDNGISYTEQEYEYAVSKGQKIIALLLKDPNKAERGKTDQDEELFKKLMAFRERVKEKRLVKLWEDGKDIVSCFLQSFAKTKELFPATGWVRGNTPPSQEVLHRIEVLEEEKQRLQEIAKRADKKQIATDIKMEACSATNPTVFSETEIECVSVIIKYKIERIDMSLFTPYSSHISKSEMISYYRVMAIPWITRMASICRLDLRITNPYAFPINNMDSEQHLFDENGNEIKTFKLEDLIPKPPVNPYYRISSVMTPDTDSSFTLNPRRPITIDRSRYYLPEKDQDCIFQRIFYAENITEPIKKEIKIHFRQRIKVFDFNNLVQLVQTLEMSEKFNDIGAFQLAKVALGTNKKEQDSCDTQK